MTLSRHDLRIDLDPAEAARICRDVWTELGQGAATDDGRAA